VYSLTRTLSDDGSDERVSPSSPYLFLVLQGTMPLREPARIALKGLQRVVFGRGAARAVQEKIDEKGRRCLFVKLEDAWMSSQHAELVARDGEWHLMDSDSKNGSAVNGRQVSAATLQDGDIVELGRCFLRFRSALPELEGPRYLEAPDPNVPTGLVTLLPDLGLQYRRLHDLAESRVSVLVHGESGTGKELVARAIHTLSRRKGRLIAVNCGGLPKTLLESMLYGHRRGAFSGATTDKVGLVQASDGGTLFLDEIGDLPLDCQAAFLRVLQEREVMPVGATESVSVDIRLVAATHRDLRAQVARGEFRDDLFSRLSGFTLTLPPLRERIEDMGIFVGALTRKCAPSRPDGVPMRPRAVRALMSYRWPRNIRELEKVLEAGFILAAESTLSLEHLPIEVQTNRADPAVADGAVDASDSTTGSRFPRTPLRVRLSDDERRRQLSELLERHQGNISAIARELGRQRNQIRRWLERLGLDASQYRDESTSVQSTLGGGQQGPV
jgi:DNA-binding NtrC family response regulator